MAIVNFLKSAYRNATVEFYIFLFFLGFALHTAASFPLFYTKICQSIYPRSICANLSSNPSMEDHVQFLSSEWLAYIELARFIPTLLGTMFLGSYGDHYSTKTPVLISLVLTIVYMSTYTILVSFDACPLYSIILASTVLAIGGQYASLITCLYSFVAKRVRDENRLTFRYAVLTAFWSAAYVVAGNLASILYSILSYRYVMVIGQAIVVATFLLALLFYPNDLPIEEKSKIDIVEKPTPIDPEIQIDRPQTPENPVSSTKDLIKNQNLINRLCLENLNLYRSAWLTITKSRPNKGRLFLIMLCLIGIVYGSQDAGMDTVTNLFAYKRPLSWTPSLLAIWSGCMSLLQMAGSLISAYVFQRFKMSNTFILIVGICSACLKIGMISISTRTWMMFVALALGCLSTVGFSALRAFVVQLGTNEETGELLGCLTATSSFIPVFSALVYNNVYSATLNDFDGSTFAVCSALLAICILAVIFIHFYLKRSS